MSTYEDLANASNLNTNLLDELKPNGVDLLLPHADFESGWVLLSRNSSVTITHNLGFVPRLVTIHTNSSAAFTNTVQFDNGSDGKATFSANKLTENTITVTNKSSSTVYKYFYLRIWM